MLNFSNATLDKIVVHGVGSKTEEDELQLSKAAINNLDEMTQAVLLSYFLKPFKTDEFYNFDTENLDANPVFHAALSIFENSLSFVEESVAIAKHLYNVSIHPNIKKGELYVTIFRDIVIDDEHVDAIGIFKSESKDTFLKVYPQGDKYNINHTEGININKLDKGCIIYKTDADMGYKLSIVDKTNKSSEAVYWKDDFLMAVPHINNFYNTANFLDICKDFSENVLTSENQVNNTDKIGFMNNSIDYFKNNKLFNEDEFKQKVLNNPEVVQAFSDFKQEFEEIYERPTESSFPISENAVKKNQKFFKSIIKLDKNFHIYVHGRHEYIEKGYDEEKELRYYKLYYDYES